MRAGFLDRLGVAEDRSALMADRDPNHRMGCKIGTSSGPFPTPLLASKPRRAAPAIVRPNLGHGKQAGMDFPPDMAR